MFLVYSGAVNFETKAEVEDEPVNPCQSIKLTNEQIDKEEKPLEDCVIELLQNTRRKHEDKLYDEHSNLNAVGVSSINSKKSTTQSICYEHCIVLYCSKRGCIPDGEDSFPKFLEFEGERIPVDVREGDSIPIMEGPRQSGKQRIKFGYSIQRYGQTKKGSLGPFVEHAHPRLAFLTCAHVCFDIGSNTGQLPLDQDESLNRVLYTVVNGNQEHDLPVDKKTCGILRSGYFIPSKGVDIAVVEISPSMTPIDGAFRPFVKDKYQNYGKHYKS